MAKRIFAWLLFAWGCFCLWLVFYYTFQFYSDISNPSRGEYWEGVGLGWSFGLPTWLGLPTLTIVFRKDFGKLFSWLINIPVFIAFAYFIWYWFPIIFNISVNR